MSSALAIADNYNPNDVEPEYWQRIKDNYRTRAVKVLAVFDAEEEIAKG